MRALIVESNNDDLDIINSALRIPWPDIITTAVSPGEKALELATKDWFDVIIVGFPVSGMTGFEFLKRLSLFSAVPAVLLKSDLCENDIVRCLEIGVSECLNKPICVAEFAARVRALLRRGRVTDDQTIISGIMRLDAAIHKAYITGEEVELTRSENIILAHLMRNKGHVISYASIACELWGDDYPGSNKAIRMHVDNIRSKIQLFPSLRLVNERGIGFRLVGI